MKFENTSVMNFKNAIRGMRNPHDSWDKSDSKEIEYDLQYNELENDLKNTAKN